MTEKKQGMKADTVSPSSILTIIKETYLHPFEESVISSSSGKVVERNSLNKRK